MSSVMDLYQENLRRQGLADAASAEPVDVPARRTVEKSTVPVPVKTSAPITPAPVAPVVRDTRVDELEARIARLEKMLAPALAECSTSEIERIELEYISLTEQGKANGLTYHQYRTLPRVQRKALMAGAHE
jgi:hypothetical protein